MTTRPQTIAFIGLGNMGGPMAANLVRAGHAVRGFDLAPASLEAARAEGVAVAGSVLEAVEGASAVVTMLPAGRHVVEVWSQVAGAVPAGTLLIDSSTVDVASAREAHALAEARSCPAIDAPVSGGTGGAKAGTLTFMAGGSEQAFAAAEPILKRMGRSVFHCGAAGAGQAAKICNNMVLGVSMLAVCEGFALAEKLGLDAQRFFDIASVSSGQCWSLTSYAPWAGVGPETPADRGFDGGFLTRLMLKDLKLAQEAAATAGASTPMGAQAEAVYALMANLGLGGKDFSVAVEMLRGRLQGLA